MSFEQYVKVRIYYKLNYSPAYNYSISSQTVNSYLVRKDNKIFRNVINRETEKGSPYNRHKSPDGEQMYSSTLSSTSALDWVSGQCHAPAALTPGKTRYPLYRRLGGSQRQYTRVRKISPLTGIRSPDRPARNEGLYRVFSGRRIVHRVRGHYADIDW